jgi:hypothetical protein
VNCSRSSYGADTSFYMGQLGLDLDKEGRGMCVPGLQFPLVASKLDRPITAKEYEYHRA